MISYVLLFLLWSPLSLWAAIPEELESVFSETTLLVRKADFANAETNIRWLIKQGGEQTEFLEIQALLFQAKKNIADAKNVYAKLLDPKRSVTEEQRASYFFEMGLILVGEKNWGRAKEYFRWTLERGFNSFATHFELGFIAYREKDWDTAESEFMEALDSNSSNLLLPTRLHLAAVKNVLHQPLGVVRHLLAARNLASEVISDAASPPTIVELAHKTLNTFIIKMSNLNNSQWVSNVSLFGGYDSNVLYVPDSALSLATAGVGSPTATFRYGIGYATSPLKEIQWIPNYSGSINYESNARAKSGQFFNHAFTLQAIHDGLAADNYGVQNELSVAFQMQNVGNDYALYNIVESIGPFGRWEFSPGWGLTMGYFLKFQKNYLDPLLASNAQIGGWDQSVSISVANLTHTRWWNPVISLSPELSTPKGKDNRFYGLDLSFNNPMYLSEDWTFVEAIDIGEKYYFSTSPKIRSDLSPSISVLALFRATKELTLLGQFRYNKNLSNVNDFRYHRAIYMLGANYLF